MHFQVWWALHRLVSDVCKRGRSSRSNCCTERSIHATRTVLFVSRSSRRLSLLKKLVMDAPQKLPFEPIIGPQTFAWCFEGRKVGAGCVAVCQMRSFMGQRRSGAGRKPTGPRPVCGKLRFVASQERTPRSAKACGVGLSPGWCGGLCSSKQNANWQRRGVAARSMEWVLSRLVEARHWAQYAVRRGATTSSVTKFSAAISSFRQGHQVTKDCQSEDLMKLREEGLLLLDRLKQITLAWVSLWEECGLWSR